MTEPERKPAHAPASPRAGIGREVTSRSAVNQVHNVAMLVSTTGTRSLLVAAVALLTVACGSSPTGPNGAASGPLRIVANQADSIVTLTVGESMALRLELDGRVQPGSSATWSTNDASIATVGADGTISGRGYGEALITARLNAAVIVI